MNHRDQKVRKRAAAVSKTLHRAMVGLLDIQTLGDFQVRRQDVPLAEDDWQRNQAKTLLKTIMARGSIKVPKDLLMEDLWPDGAPLAADRSFKVALHRLRRSLEPTLHKTFGSCYVHLRGNLISLDPSLCTVDADRLSSLIKQGKAQARNQKSQDAAGSFQAAVELYQGPFLPQDLYCPWATPRREALASQVTDVLCWLANFYELQDDLEKAAGYNHRALTIDPLREAVYRRLMSLYAQQGNRNQAINTYHRCLEALSREIDTAPQPLTESLYQKILASLPEN